jgi:hypothetical protein
MSLNLCGEKGVNGMEASRCCGTRRCATPFPKTSGPAASSASTRAHSPAITQPRSCSCIATCGIAVGDCGAVVFGNRQARRQRIVSHIIRRSPKLQPRGGSLATPPDTFELTVRTEGLWQKCDGCREIIWKKGLEQSLCVCGKCGRIFPIFRLVGEC